MRLHIKKGSKQNPLKIYYIELTDGFLYFLKFSISFSFIINSLLELRIYSFFTSLLPNEAKTKSSLMYLNGFQLLYSRHENNDLYLDLKKMNVFILTSRSSFGKYSFLDWKLLEVGTIFILCPVAALTILSSFSQ